MCSAAGIVTSPSVEPHLLAAAQSPKISYEVELGPLSVAIFRSAQRRISEGHELIGERPLCSARDLHPMRLKGRHGILEWLYLADEGPFLPIVIKISHQMLTAH